MERGRSDGGAEYGARSALPRMLALRLTTFEDALKDSVKRSEEGDLLESTLQACGTFGAILCPTRPR